jgi:flagellar biogenesis protein FliO
MLMLLAAGAFAQDGAFEEAPPPDIRLMDEAAAAPAPAKPAPDPESEPDYFQRHREEFYRDTPAPDSGTAEGAPARAADPDGGWAMALQAFFSLCLLCGVIILGGYLLRRFGKNTPLLAGARLGEVLGRVHLTPRASLHYVRSGGRVLVVGVTPNGIHPVAEFDADAFAEETAPDAAPVAAGDFLSQLKSAQAGPKPPVDEDLGALRSEIQQLQAYLRSRPGAPDA